MRILGLDFGSKTVGVAVSDALLITAQGSGNLPKESSDETQADTGADRTAGKRVRGGKNCARLPEKYEQYRRGTLRENKRIQGNA